jgi:acyl carrier protein
MKELEILQSLTDIFKEFFDDNELILTYESTAEDIEDWDSLAQVGLILSIERTFSLKLNSTEVSKLENVGEMVKLISTKI